MHTPVTVQVSQVVRMAELRGRTTEVYTGPANPHISARVRNQLLHHDAKALSLTMGNTQQDSQN